MLLISLKKFSRLVKSRILCHGHMLLINLTFKKFLKRLIKNNFKKKKKKMKQNLEKKLTKKKGDKLYVKWKGCDSLFNSSIDKKDIV